MGARRKVQSRGQGIRGGQTPRLKPVRAQVAGISTPTKTVAFELLEARHLRLAPGSADVLF